MTIGVAPGGLMETLLRRQAALLGRLPAQRQFVLATRPEPLLSASARLLLGHLRQVAAEAQASDRR